MNLLDHLEKLRVLLAISQTGSLRQAGLRLNVSQPSITRTLRILEDACGGELVKRTQKGATLTPRGYSVLGLAKEIIDCVHRHISRLDSLDSKIRGKIEIGTYESIAIYYWPAILRELQQALPNVEISMYTGRSEALEKSLLKGELDVVVTVAPKKHRGIINVELYRDYFDIYLLDGLSAASLSTVILFKDAISSFESKVSETLRINGIRIKRKILTDSLEVVRAMTLGGVGLGIMPTRVASFANSSVQNRPLIALASGNLQGVSEHVIAASYQESRKEQPVINSILKIIQSKFAVATK